MEIKEYYQGGEQAMQRHWQDDGAVYSTFDEAESEWPSSCHVSRNQYQSTGSCNLLGFCLVVRAKGIVGFR